jgi:murein DD-endopeptidase
MGMKRFTLLLILAFVFAQARLSAADDAAMKFDWPVACTVGQDCWVVNYVDDDPSPASAKDFTCGHMTYEGHDGTDIAIKDHASIAHNTSVLAAADGVVLRTRDSVEDGTGTKQDLQASQEARNGCGNAVIINHGNGWQTLYCHMKRGSISVAAGQHVKAGDKLGSVGQSGMAEFAHVHFGVMRNGQILDPFTGQPPSAGCELTDTAPLWRTPVAYETLIPYAAGFADQPPDVDKLAEDTASPTHIPLTASAFVFWTLVYGLEPGDHISLQILDPVGQVYARNDSVQDKTKIRALKYIGLRTPNHPLHPGLYTGKAVLTRTLPNGQSLTHTSNAVVTVDAP